MDPATIVQIIGTALSLGDVVCKSIIKLTSIKARYQAAPLVLSTMIGQLYIVQSALDQLQALNNPEYSRSLRHNQLARQVDNSLDSFSILILALGEQLERFHSTESSGMPVKGRLSFLWSEKEMSEYSILLDRQVNALNLLLQALQCVSWSDQDDLMSSHETIEVLRLAKDCSSSIIGLEDGSSSCRSESTDMIGMRFDFDRVILGTSVYQKAQRSHLRQTIEVSRLGHPNQTPVLTTSDEEASTSRESISTIQETPISHKSSLSINSLESPDSEARQKPTRRHAIQATKNHAKVLILGTSESGKSTLLKAFAINQGHYDDEYYKDSKEIIWSNVIQSTRVILDAMESLDLPLDNTRLIDYHVQTIFQQPAQVDTLPPQKVCKAIKILWEDGGFRDAYKRRAEYQLLDCAEPFAKDVERLMAPEYVPSNQDIIFARVKTAGICETTFNFKNLDYSFYDPGGVRSQRKKWVHVFDMATTVIFTVDTANYCKLLFENESVNRMQEQLDLFRSIVNSRWFVHNTFIIVFTKTDLLEEHFRIHPVEFYFTDFVPAEGSDNEKVDYYLQYLEKRFKGLIVSDHHQKRIRCIRARFDDIDSHNPASEILETLDDLFWTYHATLDGSGSIYEQLGDSNGIQKVRQRMLRIPNRFFNRNWN
ncbi:hypothetical protein PFICI_00339 [Pestalotiopsis fici W106-1]|uniref:Uncharacterized protein n=1 Tax=Pestalotiopsis fici (strain W106-1 / CGMCC3.15140) TaxID=1229662 RepID=W3XMJ6_PESFW|nr:uncharacterized protein PFICI_00339 [Pestalotiopsis fici W106-1]ETS86511.1 hypothetical protein PFICI_00339 [Pestalotiopsis fici W106-1]